MMTNLLATIIVSVITNWTPVYDQIDTGKIYCTATVNMPILQPTQFSGDYYWPEQQRYIQGAYLGEDGIVIEVTEFKFKYKGEDIVHCIKKPLRKIIRRCREKPVPAPELIWDEDVIEEIKPAIDQTGRNAIIVDLGVSTITLTPQ